MTGKIVLTGYWRWLAPLLLLIAGGFLAIWITRPVQEGFEAAEKFDTKVTSPQPPGAPELITKQPEPLEADAPLNAQDEKEEGAPFKEEDDDEKPKKNQIKEGYFDSTPFFENTAMGLQKGWRYRDLPKTLEPYHGPVLGFNCGQYSEFTLGYKLPSCFRDRADKKCFKVTGKESDYIFPDNALQTKGDISMPMLCANDGGPTITPNYLNESDVVQARKQSFEDQMRYGHSERISAADIDSVIRPQYRYHRGNGDENTLVGFGNYE